MKNNSNLTATAVLACFCFVGFCAMIVQLALTNLGVFTEYSINAMFSIWTLMLVYLGLRGPK